MKKIETSSSLPMAQQGIREILVEEILLRAMKGRRLWRAMIAYIIYYIKEDAIFTLRISPTNLFAW